MCHKSTIRLVVAVILAWGAALGQTAPDWRRVGGTTVDLMLAGPATGPVGAAWFSDDGARLYVRTRSGRLFQTADFENWAAAETAAAAPAPDQASAARMPETGASLLAFPGQPGRIYALGAQLYRSEDGGRSWTDLTAFRARSVIGGTVRALAFRPQDAEQVLAANDRGVWRSMDGGLTWSGINQGLPNLPVRRILATPNGTRGVRIEADGFGVLELAPGAPSWQPADESERQRDAGRRRAVSAALGIEITAVGSSGETVYAGAADGRLWVSVDAGRNWTGPSLARGGPVEAIFVDPVEPRVALAALSGTGPHVLRTINSGTFWDDVTGMLADAPAHGIAADRASGAVYVATDRGVFFARGDLEGAGPFGAWTRLRGLPDAPGADVRLDPNANQLYVALDGYGVFAAAAPHRARVLRIVNAADFSVRAAAPGSLLSVVGGRVDSARAGSLNVPVLAASDTESQIQVPFEAAGDRLSLALQTGSGPFTFGLAVQPVSPAIFVSRDGAPMILDADSGLTLEGNVARSGMRIQILATGLGRVRPDWPTGLAAPLERPPVVSASVGAFLDRVPLEVTRAELAPGYVGFYLVEVQLPAVVNAGPAELYITAGGQESNRVGVVLEP